MKINRLIALVATLCALLFVACGGRTLEPGTVVASTEAIEQDPANSGQRFAVEGYFCSPDEVTDGADEILPVTIWTEPEGEGELLATLQMRHYAAPNAFYLTTDNYTDEDARILDNEKNEHFYDEVLRFSFTATQNTNGTWTYTDVRVDPTVVVE